MEVGRSCWSWCSVWPWRRRAVAGVGGFVPAAGQARPGRRRVALASRDCWLPVRRCAVGGRLALTRRSGDAGRAGRPARPRGPGPAFPHSPCRSATCRHPIRPPAGDHGSARDRVQDREFYLRTPKPSSHLPEYDLVDSRVVVEVSEHFLPAVLVVERVGGLVCLETLQPQFLISVSERFLSPMEQFGPQSLPMESVIDHHEIDQIVPKDRIADDLAVSFGDRAVVKIV